VIAKVRKKIACGTDFFQTQAVFDRERLESFMSDLAGDPIPVLLGVVLLKGPRMARYLNEQVPGVRVPDPLLERLEAAADPLAEGIRIAREMVAWARDLCQGVHLMTFGHEALIPELLAE
jgi:5,10-methylenetetrahydrofolate reductase